LEEKSKAETILINSIKLDIIKGCFAPSLEKYKPVHIVMPTVLKPVEAPPSIETTLSPTLLHDLGSKFNDWCANEIGHGFLGNMAGNWESSEIIGVY
jgi:hypothetical protein